MVSEKRQKRLEMIKKQLEGRGIDNQQVLTAFEIVPRHKFVPDRLKDSAYEDRPLPIGNNQTISQPFIVAQMISALEPEVEDRMLEVGTGSGYATAVLSRLVSRVYTIERYPKLADKARAVFAELGYDNIEVETGDGTLGWPDREVLFDGILVSAAAPEVPESLAGQLKAGGRMVVPVGDRSLQQLYRVIKQDDDQFVREKLGGVRFVPLIGDEGWQY